MCFFFFENNFKCVFNCSLRSNIETWKVVVNIYSPEAVNASFSTKFKSDIFLGILWLSIEHLIESYFRSYLIMCMRPASHEYACVCVRERDVLLQTSPLFHFGELLFCLSFKVIKLHLQICCECLFKWLRFKNILMTFLVWLCNLFNIFTSVYPIGKTYLLLSSAKTLSLSLFPPQKRKKLFLLVIV